MKLSTNNDNFVLEGTTEEIAGVLSAVTAAAKKNPCEGARNYCDDEPEDDCDCDDEDYDDEPTGTLGRAPLIGYVTYFDKSGSVIQLEADKVPAPYVIHLRGAARAYKEKLAPVAHKFVKITADVIPNEKGDCSLYVFDIGDILCISLAEGATRD